MSADCKIQINFKNGQPDLINVYAEDGFELVKLLGQLSESVSDITAASNFLKGAQTVAPIAQGASTGTYQAPPAQAAPTLPSAAAPSSKPSCHHGEKVWRTGNSAKGPWKGWFCPSPKGTPDQCPPEFVRS